MPCPHDPSALSVLSVEGQSKLKMEVDAAKKSSHLVVLSDLQKTFNRNSKVQPDTCLIEQESVDREKEEKETVLVNAVRMKQRKNVLPSESDFK